MCLHQFQKALSLYDPYNPVLAPELIHNFGKIALLIMAIYTLSLSARLPWTKKIGFEKDFDLMYSHHEIYPKDTPY